MGFGLRGRRSSTGALIEREVISSGGFQTRWVWGDDKGYM